MKPKSHILARHELRRRVIDPDKVRMRPVKPIEPPATEAVISCAFCTTDPQRPAFMRHTYRCEMRRRDGAWAEHWGCDGCGNLRVYGVSDTPQRTGTGVQ